MPKMANPKEAPWTPTPQFGGWDQKSGGTTDYSMVFSRARANRKEHKSDIKRASIGNEKEFIIPPFPQHDQEYPRKRKSLIRYFSCCYVPTTV